MGKSQALYRTAKKIIPGGTQLLSKRPEMFLPENWPAYYSKAKGCEIWDLDKKRYIDMSYMGIGACILGYADAGVDKAVKYAVDSGNMTTLNVPEEVELAKILIKIHPWSEMVRYARTGGEAMAIAVRLARAKSGKDKILFCGYHGWHDWYLSANLANNKSLDGHLLPGLNPRGVPRGLTGTSIPFTYNNREEFKKKFFAHKDELAAVVMEPIRNYYPQKNFLETIRRLTEKFGIALIFDEVTSGFRLTLGGAHLLFKVNPDIVVLGKAISNGYPMAAIIGTKGYMNYAQESFISSTYWTDKIGSTAALKTIKLIKQKQVVKYLNKIGKFVQNEWLRHAKKHNLDITVSGIYPLGHFEFNYDNKLAIKTLMTQLMLKRGYLATTAYYASYAQKMRHVRGYIKALDQTFKIIKQAIQTNTVEKKLEGPICHSGFKRLI